MMAVPSQQSMRYLSAFSKTDERRSLLWEVEGLYAFWLCQQNNIFLPGYPAKLSPHKVTKHRRVQTRHVLDRAIANLLGKIK